MPRKAEKLNQLTQALREAWGAARFSHGNRCGNDPEVLRPFTPPVSHHARPPIICDFIHRIEAFYANPRLFETLAFRPGKDRQMNSCRREACIQVLGVLAHYFDLATLRVGVPQPNCGLVGIDMVTIAQRAKITLRRAERAMADLVKAGLVTVKQIHTTVGDGTFRGRSAIRTLSASLFKVVGLGKALKREHKKAVERRRKRDPRPAKDSRAEGRLELHRQRLRTVLGLCHSQPPQPSQTTQTPPLEQVDRTR